MENPDTILKLSDTTFELYIHTHTYYKKLDGKNGDYQQRN